MELCKYKHFIKGFWNNHTLYIKVFPNILDTSIIITQLMHDIPKMLVTLQVYKQPQTNYLTPYNLYSSTKPPTRQFYTPYARKSQSPYTTTPYY